MIRIRAREWIGDRYSNSQDYPKYPTNVMPFFVIRQTALRRLAYSTSTHKPLPNLRYSIPSFNARRNTSLKPTTSITYSPYLCRYYTTPRPSSSTEVKTDSEPPLPPAKPRKPKVDLRPGPVKPTSVGPTDSTPRPPKTVAPTEEPQPSTSASTAREPALSGTQPDAQTSPTNHIPDAIKEAMAHIQRATQEGVLLPPPENASRFGRLYHQAKELFKFYFRGLKALWTHRGMVAEIRNRVKQEGGLAMTRWESQFVRTYKRDLKKYALCIF
jgi:LETM1 and EF-hand domain-containing protein 1